MSTGPEPTISDWETSTNVAPPEPAAEGAPPAADDGTDAPAGAAATPAAEDGDPPPAPAADSERDEQGRFRGRRRRGRDQAGPDDVPRIRELSSKVRDLEAKLAERQIPPAAPAAPVASTPARAVAPAAAAPAAPAAPAFSKPKPTLQEFLEKEGPTGDYNKAVEAHAEALTDWKLDKRDWDATQTAAQARQKSEADRIATSWKTKTAAALKKYPDFQAVALDADTRIPQGSLVDAWILEHKSGADVLYHLQKHPTDLDAVLALSPIDQAEWLTLLGQRLAGRPQADSTGAAGAPQTTPSPRPPTPVRTSSTLRSDDKPPDDNASLEEHERFYGHGPRRRRRG